MTQRLQDDRATDRTRTSQAPVGVQLGSFSSSVVSQPLDGAGAASITRDRKPVLSRRTSESETGDQGKGERVQSGEPISTFTFFAATRYRTSRLRLGGEADALALRRPRQRRGDGRFERTLPPADQALQHLPSKADMMSTSV